MGILCSTFLVKHTYHLTEIFVNVLPSFAWRQSIFRILLFPRVIPEHDDWYRVHPFWEIGQFQLTSWVLDWLWFVRPDAEKKCMLRIQTQKRGKRKNKRSNSQTNCVFCNHGKLSSTFCQNLLWSMFLKIPISTYQFFRASVPHVEVT